MSDSSLEQDTQPIRPAATVVVMRDAAEDLELLLLKRAAALAFYAGAWVFPGGRVDPGDGDLEHALTDAARRAAVRELEEEAGLTVAPEALRPISRWLTPPGRARRFDTFHFVVPAPDQPVKVQPSEVSDHRWLTARAALAAHAQGELELPPPTFVTLSVFAPLRSIAEVHAAIAGGSVHYIPRAHAVEGGFVYVYAGDAAYESGLLEADGGRHRLHAIGRNWRYER
jgi:8-oxo-dGTP pyrophosphatase MutT (NUDIX family)